MMVSDSIVRRFDWSGFGKPPAGKPSESRFWDFRDGQLGVHYFHFQAEVQYRPHIHPEYAVVVCLQGMVGLRQLGQATMIGPGEGMISNFGVEHSSSCHGDGDGGCEAICISLDPALLAVLTRNFDLPPSEGRFYPAFTGKVQAAMLHQCARSMVHELQGQQRGHQIILETQAVRLLVETIRRWPRTGIQQVEVDLSPRLSRREFHLAYEFMRACRKQDFRLQNLCRFLGSSEERFARLFNASTGDTPASFYNRLLLDRAVNLLRRPRLAIKEVGFELGFKTSSHFVAAFRREYGVSPQEFRRRGDCTALVTVA